MITKMINIKKIIVSVLENRQQNSNAFQNAECLSAVEIYYCMSIIEMTASVWGIATLYSVIYTYFCIFGLASII